MSKWSERIEYAGLYHTEAPVPFRVPFLPPEISERLYACRARPDPLDLARERLSILRGRSPEPWNRAFNALVVASWLWKNAEWLEEE